MTDRVNKLSEFEAMEISVVDEGANLKKRFPITKEKHKMDFEAILKSVAETEIDNEDKLDAVCKAKGVSDKGTEAFKAAYRILKGFEDEIPAEVLKEFPFAVEEDDEEEDGKKKKKKEKEKEKEDKVKKAEEEDEEMKAKEKKEKKEKDKLDKALKSNMEAVIKAHKAELEVVKKQLEVVEDARSLDVWTNKAKEELSHFPGKSHEELGEIFKSLAKTDTELADKLFADYKASSDALKASNILKRAGTSQSGVMSGSAEEKINKMAKKVSTSEKVSIEKAHSIVMDRDPGLYAEYIKETE